MLDPSWDSITVCAAGRELEHDVQDDGEVLHVHVDDGTTCDHPLGPHPGYIEPLE